MPLSDDEIREKINDYDKSLPEPERNPKIKQDVEKLIELSAKPLPKGKDKQPESGRYSGKQTRSRKPADTSG